MYQSASASHPEEDRWFHYDATLPAVSRQPLDRITYFDTVTHTYLVATNSIGTHYRVIKFTKDDERLDVHFDSTVHEKQSVVDLVQTLKAGSGKNLQTGKARAILGFVRFTRGYYLILVAKRRETARIGPHRIFEVRGTVMISLCEHQEQRLLARRSDEDYYRDQFLKFDLSEYFYYSHSYDITNTLQSNMTFNNNVSSLKGDVSEERTSGSQPFASPSMADTIVDPFHPNESDPFLNSSFAARRTPKASQGAGTHVKLGEALLSMADATQPLQEGGSGSTLTTPVLPPPAASSRAASPNAALPPPKLRNTSPPIRRKFVWNEFLLEPCCVREGAAAPDDFHAGENSEFACNITRGILVSDAWAPWVVFTIRGCVGHCKLETTASPANMVLIGRTSKNFAGARYLRRGVNDDGHVANHVEVEQIVYMENSLTRFGTKGRFSSYVQVRGSVPVHWFHAMVQRPKPPILLGRCDPFYNSTRLHFEEIVEDFGAPIVLMNLLKTNEKKRREAVLTAEYTKAFSLLTKEMPGPRDKLPIRYLSFDLRNAADRAWNSMAAFAERDSDDIGVFACDHTTVRLQRGVVRSNCVDCIDRTNLAQFFFGLHALGKQLTALGILHAEVDLGKSSDAVYEVVLRMYLKLGDAIAIQYGGSAQVGAGILHRGIGWDKVMGIRRLYNNLVTDKDKQQVTNLFLGLYQPCPDPLMRKSSMALPLHRRAQASLIATNNRNSTLSATRGAQSPLDQSTTTDWGTVHSDRRVVDIHEAEADYYLHCTDGLRIASGDYPRDWWLAPLARFNERVAHLQCLQEDAPRKHSKYSSLRRQRRSHHSADLMSTPTDSHITLSPQCGALQPPRPHLQRAPLDDAVPVITSDAQVIRCKSEDVMAMMRECWITDRFGKADSDEEPEPAVGLDPSSAPPILTATSSRTSLSHDALTDCDQVDRMCSLLMQEAFSCPLGLSDGHVAASPLHFSNVAQSVGPRFAASMTGGGVELRRQKRFVVPDPEQVVYWDRGPDYGNTCEVVHNHQTFPDEVHHSLYQKEIDELRRTCDRPHPKHELYKLFAAALIPFGNPMEWTPEQVCEALQLVFPEQTFKSTLQHIRSSVTTGAVMLNSKHFDQFHQHSLMKELVTIMRLLPVVDEAMVEHYFQGLQDMEAMDHIVGSGATTLDHVQSDVDLAVLDGLAAQRVVCQYLNGKGASGGGSGSKRGKLDDLGGDLQHPAMMFSVSATVAFPEQTTSFLESFAAECLTASTAELLIRDLVFAMSLPHDRDCIVRFSRQPTVETKLRGVKRQDRLRYHDRQGSRIPEPVIMHHTFWFTTLQHWLTDYSKELGFNFHREPDVAEARHRCCELIAWMAQADLIVKLEIPSGSFGVDVASTALKDLSSDRLMTLFTLPSLLPKITLNVQSLITAPSQTSPRNNQNSVRAVYGSEFLGSARGGGTRGSGRGAVVPSEYFSQYSAKVLPITPDINIGLSAVQFAECFANLAFSSLNQLEETSLPSAYTSIESVLSNTTELCHVDLSLLNSESRLCFFVNIFNCLYIHAWITALQRPSVDIRTFMKTYGYQIGGYYFSLHDIKHGIIRRNRPNATEVIAPFAPTDERISFIPNEEEGREYKSKVLLALIDCYLLPERIAELSPYHPKNFLDDGAGSSSLHNSSMAAPPVVYEDGFELVDAGLEESSEDEDDNAASPKLARHQIGGGSNFFSSWFRSAKNRGPQVPPHYCIALVPQMFLEQLNSIEASFMTAIQDPSQPQTSVNGGPQYPRLLQGLIGMEEVGRTSDEVMRHMVRKRMKHHPPQPKAFSSQGATSAISPSSAQGLNSPQATPVAASSQPKR